MVVPGDHVAADGAAPLIGLWSFHFGPFGAPMLRLNTMILEAGDREGEFEKFKATWHHAAGARGGAQVGLY